MYFRIRLIGNASDDRILLGLIFPVVIIGLVCAIFLICKKREKVRTEKLTNFFQELGFPLQAAADPVRIERISVNEYRSRGQSRLESYKQWSLGTS